MAYDIFMNYIYFLLLVFLSPVHCLVLSLFPLESDICEDVPRIRTVLGA